MKCIILAGSFGTKLYPLTENFPKPLLDVANKTIIDRLVNEFSSVKAIDGYYVVTNHRYYSAMLGWSLERKEDITVIDDKSVDPDNVYGSVKDIELALSRFSGDDFIISASDLLFDFSLISFFGYIQRKGTSCLMRYYEDNEIRLRKNTVASINVNDKILRMVNKPFEPESYWTCPQFYFIKNTDRELIGEYLKSGDINSLGDMISYISGKTELHAMEIPGRIYRITNDNSLKKARKEFMPYNG